MFDYNEMELYLREQNWLQLKNKTWIYKQSQKKGTPFMLQVVYCYDVKENSWEPRAKGALNMM